MPNLKLFGRYALLPVFIIMNSCFKDIDLEQANEIVIPPKAALDLVYFTLELQHFTPHNTTGPKMAEDVVRLEFIDDDYIQDGLVRADLNFRFTNTFTSPILCDIIFLSENNSERYRINFLIPGGSPEVPGVVDYTEIIQGADLEAFKQSIKMRLELEMLSGVNAEGGKLQLKSKAFLNLEY